MRIVRTRKYVHWWLPLAIIGSLSIFTFIFLAFASAHASHRGVDSILVFIGFALSVILMVSISYLSLPGPRSFARFFTAVGIAIIECAAFFFLLMLLLVNTFGE